MIGAILARIGARRGWDAANRRDLDYFERYMADDVVMEIPGRPPIGGRFVGRAACRSANQRWMDSLAAFEYRVIRIAVTNPLAIGLTNTVLTEFELAETTHDGRTHLGRGVDVSELKGGKWVAGRTYMFDLEAEEAMRRPPVEEAHLDAETAPGEPRGGL